MVWYLAEGQVCEHQPSQCWESYPESQKALEIWGKRKTNTCSKHLSNINALGLEQNRGNSTDNIFKRNVLVVARAKNFVAIFRIWKEKSLVKYVPDYQLKYESLCWRVIMTLTVKPALQPLNSQPTRPTPPKKTNQKTISHAYCQISNISGTLVGHKIVDHSDVVEASPVGAAPTTSSFWT